MLAKGDEGIDFSDIPESPPDAVWMNREQARAYRQQRVTLDPDIASWFGGRQEQINAVLRDYMRTHPQPPR